MEHHASWSCDTSEEENGLGHPTLDVLNGTSASNHATHRNRTNQSHHWTGERNAEMNKNLKLSLFLACTALLCAACSTTDTAKNFNGLSTPDGTPIAHMRTSNLAIHLLATTPLVGNATLDQTVADFTRAAKTANAGNVRIVQSSVFKWWFILPPFSFVLTPVSSNVSGDALP
jgi:hypothetical protein